MANSDTNERVLVVDDEQEVADAYAIRLQREYEVETAYGGAEAVEAIDDSFDAVLLDRRMPEMSGGDVLERIREEGYDVEAVMVTAVDADFDIIDMPFDAYLNKPVDADEMFDTLDELLSARSKDEAVSELFSVTAKIGVLEQEKSQSQLEANKEYQQLKQRAEELRTQVHGDDTAGESTDDGAAADDATAADDGVSATGDGGRSSSTSGGTDGGADRAAAAASGDGAGREPAAAAGEAESTGGGLSTTATAVGVGVLLIVALGGTFSSPMSTSTKLMVGVGQAVLLVLAVGIGVKHGEYRASA